MSISSSDSGIEFEADILALFDDWSNADTTSDETSSNSSVTSSTAQSKRRKITGAFGQPEQTILSVLKSSATPRQPRTERPRRSKYVLYAFPMFDRCDSLLYFPNTLTRYLNSSDFASTKKLLNAHLDKNCIIKLNCHMPVVDQQTLINFYAMMDEVHPDQFMCVRETKVVENEIRTSIYKKFTACRFIRESVARSSPTFKKLPGIMRMQMNDPSCVSLNNLDEEAKKEVYRLIKSKTDCVVYMKLDFVLTFDDFTKKVVKMTCEPLIQSVHPIEWTGSPLC